MARLSSVFVCLLMGISSIAAAPAASDAVEVIPGPGLPSLASLNLTSADLFKMEMPKTARADSNQLSKRFNARCQTTNLVNVNNAVACFNYLWALGTTPCTFSGENIVFCTAGDTDIDGSNISQNRPASSFCSDVALGALWVIDNCQINGGVEGAQAANGNGDLVVSIEPTWFL